MFVDLRVCQAIMQPAIIAWLSCSLDGSMVCSWDSCSESQNAGNEHLLNSCSERWLICSLCIPVVYNTTCGVKLCKLRWMPADCSHLQHNRLQGMTGLFKEASKMQEVNCGPLGGCLTSVDVYICDIEQVEIHMTAQAG